MFKVRKLIFMLSIALFIMAGAVQAQNDEFVELIFIYPANNDPAGLPAVEEALNEILAERINAHVELRQMDFSSFGERMPLINASGEPFDIVFTAPWINNFYQNVTDEILLPLDDYLDGVPALAAEFDDSLWAVTTVGGSIYGIPGRQWFPKTFGFSVNAAFADKYGLSEDVVQSITRFAELTPYMIAMKEGEGDGFFPLGTVHALPRELIGFDPIIGDLVGVSFDADPANPVAVNTIASEAYGDFMKLRREWQDLALTPFNPITREEATDGLANGLYAFEFAYQERPNSKTAIKTRSGYDAYIQGLAQPVLTTASMNATMLAVNADSKHPERALQFLELLQTDVEVFNLLAKGIEDVSYNFVDADRGIIEFTDDNPYAPNVDWMFGNSYIAYVTDEAQLDWTRQGIEMNKSATPSPILGFVFDPVPVEMQLAALNGIAGEYEDTLLAGLAEDVDAMIADYLSALESAGMQTVLDEVNDQIQAWLATR